MLHPKPWNLEMAGSQAGPPGQDSGGDPDRSQSHTGLAQPRTGGQCAVPGPQSGKEEGFPPSYPGTWANPMPSLDLNVTVYKMGRMPR